MGKFIFGVLEKTLFWGVLGAWMTFKKPEMDKTLWNGLSMIETDPLNHKWLDFVIQSGLALHQFQKKLLLNRISDDFHGLHNESFYPAQLNDLSIEIKILISRLPKCSKLFDELSSYIVRVRNSFRKIIILWPDWLSMVVHKRVEISKICMEVKSK